MRGRPLPCDLWGKFTPPERGGPAWHPLLDHSIDVACVLEALLAQPTVRRRLARAGGLADLDALQVARLCYLAFLHDLGKCCRGFRAKAAERPVGTCGHIAALKPLFDSDLTGRFCALLDVPTLQHWCGDALEPLLAAVVAHHGKPVPLSFNATEDRALHAAWLAKDGDDPFEHLDHLLDTGRRLFATGFAEGSPLPGAPAFQHLFAGLLMLADWLGSGSAAEMFPFSEADHGPRAPFARRRASEVLGQVGLHVEPLRARLAGDLPSFDAQFRFAPRPAQTAIDRLPLPEAGGGVVLLESETGSGKTEAALRWATRLFAAGRVDGLFFAVPLRSAAVQLHDRLRRWLDATFPETEAEALLAVPGYFRMGEAEGRALPDFAVQWTDDEAADRRLARWAAEQPKRYAAATFAVGTVDQALLAVLQTAHAHLRAACLVRHLLVVDEVHSSDPYMRALVERLVSLFRACGGHVLLMSATLGAEARTRLLDGTRARVPPLAEATATAYPRITTSFGAPVDVAPEGHTKRVAVDILPLLDDSAGIAASAAEAADNGAKVLILRNTVGAAIETQIALEDRLGAEHPALFRVEGVTTLHHGRFAAEDRKLLDATIQARVGKDAPAGPVVVVATQTVEQSLDVDFDLILTDLCPIDVLLQRIGRLHRHERPKDQPRPAGFDQARCFVLGPASADLTPFLSASRHGLGFGRDGKSRAYPDLRMIEAVRRLIGRGTVWTIPDENRQLVEGGTHPEVLERIAAKLGDAWRRHGQNKKGGDMAQVSQALVNAIAFDKPFSYLAFPDPKAIKIATRLGLDDLLLSLEHPIRSPFGAALEHLRIPGWMVRPETWAALDGLDEPRIGVAPDGRLVLGGQCFSYNRLGLRLSTETGHGPLPVDKLGRSTL